MKKIMLYYTTRFFAISLLAMGYGAINAVMAEKQKKITPAQLKELQNQRDILIKGLRTKAGEIFGANVPYILYVNDPIFFKKDELNELSGLFTKSQSFIKENLSIADKLKKRVRTHRKKEVRCKPFRIFRT